MEYWNVGIMGKRERSYSFHFSLPNIPFFHYSIVPVLFQRPFLQPFVIRGAADPFAGLFVKEEWDASAVSFVVLSHQFGIGLIMPDLQLRHLDPCFILQPLHERFYLMAVGSFGTGEL